MSPESKGRYTGRDTVDLELIAVQEVVLTNGARRE
jgi:hypothetical protein